MYFTPKLVNLKHEWEMEEGGILLFLENVISLLHLR